MNDRNNDGNEAGGQFSLPGIERPPRLTHRLFFAVLPDEQAIARITKLTSKMCGDQVLRGTPILPQRLHVSLAGLGDHVEMPHALINLARRAMSLVSLSAFTASFDRVLSFGGGSKQLGRHAVVLRSSKTSEFEQLLRLQIAAVSPRDTRRAHITPHITLLYDERVVAEHSIEPIDWIVREFVLIHSVLGQGRPYSILDRWGLR